MTHPAGPEAVARNRLLAEEQAALRRVATLVAEGATAADLFAAVAREVTRVLGVPSVVIARYEPERKARVLASFNEPRFEVGTVWPLDGPSVSATVLETGRPARIDDYSVLPGTIAAGVRESAVGSTVGAPIVVDKAVWGVITVGAREGDLLPGEAEDQLGEFTELVAIAISNAESRDSVRRLAEEQAALRRVATLVARTASPDELFSAVADEVAHLFGLRRIEVVRYGADRTGTVIGASGDHPFPVGSSWSLDGPSIMESVFRTGRPARIDDYGDLDGAIAEVARSAGFRSAIGAPIVVGGRIWGAIIAISTADGGIPEGSEDRLGHFTNLVATSVSNLQAHDDLRDLASVHAALRRVATLVAEGAAAGKLFSAVADEVVKVFGVPAVMLARYESDREIRVLASVSEPSFVVGSRWQLDGPSVSAIVLETGHPARIDDCSELPGSIAAGIRDSNLRGGVACPIVVDGTVWGVITIGTRESEPLPSGTEDQLSHFGELLATAISNAASREGLQVLANEQAALRRVATLVAQGTDSPAVFDTVCAETGRLVGAASVNLSHYTPDGFNVTMAGWSLRDTHVPIGARFPISPDTVGGAIVRTRAPARVDSWEGATSELAKLVSERGIRSSLGAPVVVDGQLWGALVAATDEEEPLPAGTELRLARFAELIATAISNATTRSELIASRARIVSAGDEARRRIERNLHDGTQQRLIALGLDLQRIRATVPEDQAEVRAGLENMTEDIASVLEDVRELSRGLHPPLLARGGLRRSLAALTRRSSVPVDMEIDLDERPPAPIETAVYYVVSEALTNAIKHSQASAISVTIVTDHAGGPFGVGLDGRGRIVNLHATIADDGVGGAEASVGSGLMGLIDRVDALGGRFTLESPHGNGTRISVELPLDT